MMSLTKITASELIKKQFRFKLNIHFQVFFSMMIVQVFAIVMSIIIFSGGSGNYSGYLDSTVDFVGSEFVLFLSFIWAVTMGCAITRRGYRDVDFSFVSTRFTSIISTFLFLLFMSMVAGLGVFLSDFLVKSVVILLNEGRTIVVDGTYTLEEAIISLFAPFFYLAIASIVGYFVGFTFRLGYTRATVIVGLVMGAMVLEFLININIFGGFSPLMLIISESNFIILLVKSIAMLLIMLILLVLMSRRWEVKRL